MDETPHAHLVQTRKAAMISGLTLASRAAGFVRMLVAASVLGLTFLGNVYASSNAVPNLLFEIVAGGALAAVVVPSLSGVLAGGQRAQLSETASALATRTLAFLTPIVIVALFLRGPLMQAVTSRVGDAVIQSSQRELGEFLLLAFLPQIWLYGLGMVLTGVLHAHNRFAAPALAPLLSSATMIAVYLIYGAIEGSSAQDIQRVSTTGRLMLGLGTTAGVVVLSGCLIPSVVRLGLRWRPRWKMGAAELGTIKRLLGSAVIAVASQQAVLAAVVVIANSVEGGVVAYQLAFSLMLLPWATLAVPVATVAFPSMTEAAARSASEFSLRSADAARTIALVVFGGAAILFAVAEPLSSALSSVGIGNDSTTSMVSSTVVAFVPALVGYGGYAFLVRAAYALGDGRSPAIASMVAFGGALLGDLAAAYLFEGAALVAALGASFSAGMILGSALLLKRIGARTSRASFEGLGAACVRGLLSGGAAAAIGAGGAAIIPAARTLWSFLFVLLIALVTGGVYLAGQRMLGDRQVKSAAAVFRKARWNQLESRS